MFVTTKRFNAALNEKSRAEAASTDAHARLKDASDERMEMQRSIDYLTARLDIAHAKTAEAQGRLALILSMETPGMAWIGKRMVRAARGEKA